MTGMEIFDKTLSQYEYCKEAMVNTQYQYQYCQVAKVNTQYQYCQKAKVNTQYQYQYRVWGQYLNTNTRYCWPLESTTSDKAGRQMEYPM